MISQLLFGEVYEIAENTAEWLRITTEFDGYEGWIDKKMFTSVSEDYYQRLSGEKYAVASQVTEIIVTPESGAYIISAGSTLGFARNDGTLEINSIRYRIAGQTGFPMQKSPADLIETARQLLNSPYLWGGRSPFGYDCSGFTQVVYKIIGVRLPRDAWQQASVGQSVVSVNDAARGDLVFFTGNEGRVVHVGLAIPPGQIIHCSGAVRIDALDEKGIFNVQINQYTHRLHSIKRVV